MKHHPSIFKKYAGHYGGKWLVRQPEMWLIASSGGVLWFRVQDDSCPLPSKSMGRSVRLREKLSYHDSNSMFPWECISNTILYFLKIYPKTSVQNRVCVSIPPSFCRVDISELVHQDKQQADRFFSHCRWRCFIAVLHLVCLFVLRTHSCLCAPFVIFVSCCGHIPCYRPEPHDNLW